MRDEREAYRVSQTFCVIDRPITLTPACWETWLVYLKATGVGIGVVAGQFHLGPRVSEHPLLGLTALPERWQALVVECGPQVLRWDGTAVVVVGH